MGFFHVFGDARMPVWGVLAIWSNLLLGLLTQGVHRGLCLLSFAVLVLFVVIYNLLSKPINRLQTEAAKTGRTIEDARGIQASWDRSVMIRVPLLSVSILAQTIALSGYLAGM
jgi:hypothetical protein